MKNQNKTKLKNYSAPVISMCFGAWINVFSKVLSEDFNSFFIVSFRSLIVVIIVMIIFRNKINLKKLIKTDIKDKYVLILAGFFFGLAVTTMISGIKEGALLVNVPIILSSVSIIVYFLSYFMLGTKIKLAAVPIFLLSIYGISVITTSSFKIELIEFNLGETLVAISAIFFAFYSIYQKKAVHKFNLYEVTLGITFVTFVFTLLISIFTGSFSEGLGLLDVKYSTMFIVLGGLVIGMLFFANYSSRQIGATLTSFINRIQIIFAAILGYFLFDESINVYTVVGGSIIIIASVLMVRVIGERK